MICINQPTSTTLIACQEQFLHYLDNVREQTAQVELADNGLTELTQRIEQAELIVPVVGGFSAGKSTLINSFLGSDLLPTAITPETALATELRYSTTDYIEAVQADGNIQRYEISQLPEIKDNAKNFKFLRLFLNNQNLAEIQPLVLVDMPGFDAPIENHRNAILEYLNRGTYFVFLTSVEDGTITRTMHQEIKNLRLFGKGFSFCLSKTNLRTPSDVKQVQQAIQIQLKTQYRFEQDVVLLDDNGGANLKQILTAIQPEQLFKSLFISDLQDNYFRNEESLRLKIATLKHSKEEGEEAINVLQEGINKLQVKKAKAIEEVESRSAQQGVENIANSVGQAVMAQRENLISLALNNHTEFERVLNNTVQSHLLAEVKTKMQSISLDVINDFRLELKANFSSISESFKLDDAFTQRISDSTNKLLQGATQAGLSSLAGKFGKGGWGGMVISVVSFVLPYIFDFFTSSSKEDQLRRQQQEQRSAVEKQLLMEVLPQIKSKIRETLPPVFQKNVAELIQQIAAQFEEELAQKQAEVAQAIAEKEAKATEINALIEQLEAVKQALSDLAKPVLFA